MALTNASRLADFGTGIGTQGAILQVDNADQMVGIGTTDPTSKLEVKGDFKVSAASTLSGAVKISDSTNSTSTTTGALIVTGGVGIGASLHVDGDVSIGGTLTYEDVTNIDSVGIVTARAGVNVSGGQLQVGVAYSVGNAGVATAAGFVGPLTGNVTGNISGGTVAGSTGTFTGDVDIADKIVHTGDTNTALRFPSADTITAETGGSERARIDSSGRLIVGAVASNSVGGFGGAALQVEGLNAATSAMSLLRHSNDTASSTILLGKSRGTSDAATTIVQSGDAVGRLIAYGADGTDIATPVGGIEFAVDGTPGENDMPGRIVFKTTADGANDYTERLRIDSSGRLLIGKTSGSFKLEVSGDESTMRLTNSGESGSGNENCKLVAGGSHYQNLVHVGSAISFRTYNGSSEGERWRIRSNGHLESNDTNLYLLRTGTTGDNDICFGDSADDDIGRIRYDHDDNSIQFTVNTAESLRIEDGGRAVFYNPNDMTNPDIGGSYAGVVINKAGVGNIYAATDTGSDGTASVVLNLSRRNGSYDGPQIVLDRGGWAKASIAGLQGSNTASSAAGHFAIYTHNAGAGTRDERLRITGDNGHCGIGTIDPYAPLTIMGSAETNGTNIADHGIMLHAPGALHQDVIGITASFEPSGNRPRAGIGFISHPTADPIEGYAGEIGFYTRDAADGSSLGAADERMRIHRNGDISIASTNAHGSLTIGYDTGSSLATYADNGQEGLTFNVDRIDSDNYLGTCDMVVNRSSDATNGGTQFRFFTQPRTTGNPINVLTLTREGVTERSSRNANVKTYEFSYTDGAGGSGQNKNLFTVNADGNANTTLVFNLDYVGNYGAADDKITTGQWIGGIRRADSGTTWSATTPQLVGENGSGDSDLDVSWSSDTLQANASAWMGWTVFVRVTVYNGSITINC